MRRTAITRRLTLAACLTVVIALLGAAAPEARGKGVKKIPLAEARIFFEYNSTANDLGAHVFLDGEAWKRLKILSPIERKRLIFEVEGKGSYKKTGLTELFFEGEEPSLVEVPAEEFLARFPEGEYEFFGKTVEGDDLVGTATLTHAVPAGPSNVSAVVGPSNTLTISWDPVTGPAKDFPAVPIVVVGYQVIVGAFEITLPASSRSVTVVSPEFVASLGSGAHAFEVLAIEAGGNQTITEGSFTTQ